MASEKQIKKVQKLRALARKHNLSAPEEFWTATDEYLADNYNGAGPDWLPQWGRAVLTFFLWLFAAAFLIHDFQFTKSDKSEKGFAEANSEMLYNMLKLNDAKFGSWWLKPLHTCWRDKAYAAYAACKVGGWSAWCN